MSKKKNNASSQHAAHRLRPYLIALLLFALCIGVANLFLLHRHTPSDGEETVHIPTGSTFDKVVDSLNAHGCLANEALFRSVAVAKRYPSHIKAGCYRIEPHISATKLLKKLYSGSQDAVHLIINKQRTKQGLCQHIARHLEMPAAALYDLLCNDSVCQSLGLTTDNIMTLFVPNTYDVYWNTSPERLLQRMQKESSRFWSIKRTRQCNELGLTPQEVYILASIVEEETNKNDEKPLVAAVYLNRLRKGMLLQADPTLRYALGDFTIQRVLNEHKTIASPYNTYMHPGLPPGPICTASIASIDAVLANKQVPYLYFCAKEDFSGYHAFATTLEEHQRNAHRFHQALNQRKIYR